MLDAGAVIAVSRGDLRLRARLRAASRDNVAVVVPPAVVTQTVRDRARDAPINHLLRSAIVPACDLSVARAAGWLLARTSTSDIADAQIVAEAARWEPCAILTGDVDDLKALAEGRWISIERI